MSNPPPAGPRKFGLFLKPKPTPAPTPTLPKLTLQKRAPRANPLRASSALSDSDNDEADSDEGGADVPISDLSAAGIDRQAAAAEQKKVNRELRVVQAQRSLRAEEAQRKALEEDPTVFDYDGVYDQIKAAEDAVKKERDNPDGTARKKGG
ncbi:hypothetical protein BDK51DRAFT_45629 [Blyttiomyces helicus]|uniref:Nuclear speckle splicing regulatory protein 1 N-terminal domain-containing protein n=1 Tax=Blyttiomyces helicus TaxID=388810 RepID=A0A4P9VX56_9FUNG|nr:hypothetical protein BDK51DRAFT_45629 [Blyttiomyces helicus]|eukprot:RKO82860.1 hypothetical protein BDK51DRAFT_45629 [Blyttiomyces helicus]